jgi:hypothetical protein
MRRDLGWRERRRKQAGIRRDYGNDSSLGSISKFDRNVTLSNLDVGVTQDNGQNGQRKANGTARKIWTLLQGILTTASLAS